MDPSRKKTGGKIEIQVNLREPLTGEDIVKRSERWLVLDSFGSTASQYLSLAGLTVGGPYTNPNTPQLENLSVANSPVVSQPRVSSPVDEVTPVNTPHVNTRPVNTPYVHTQPVIPSSLKTPANTPSVSQPDAKMSGPDEEGGELEQAEEEFNR